MKRVFVFEFVFFFALIFLCQAWPQEELSWQACLKEAAQNHPDLISAKEKIKQKEELTRVTKSGLYPQVNAELNLSTSEKSGGRATNVSSGSQSSYGASGSSGSSRSTTNSFSYGVSGSQLIFDGFKTINQVKAAKEEAAATEQEYVFASSQIRFNLRTAFVNALKAQEALKVAEEIIKIRRDSLILVTLRYQSGLEHKGAVLTAQANLAQANYRYNQAKRELELAQRQLTREMGRKKFSPMLVKQDFSMPLADTGQPDFEELANSYPALLAATARKNAAFFSIKSTYADFFPRLSGTAGANTTNTNNATKASEWALGLGLTMPIFEGGLRLAQVSQAQAAYRQAEADERSIRDAAAVSLAQSWMSLQGALEAIDVQNKSLDAALERAKIAEAQYSTGFINFDNWIIIQDALVSAKQAILDARANALFAQASWTQAKGETLEYAQ